MPNKIARVKDYFLNGHHFLQIVVQFNGFVFKAFDVAFRLQPIPEAGNFCTFFDEQKKYQEFLTSERCCLAHTHRCARRLQ